jgi:hypothetical protein
LAQRFHVGFCDLRELVFTLRSLVAVKWCEMWESNPLEPSHWQCDVQPLTLISLMRSLRNEPVCINTYTQEKSKFHKWVECSFCNKKLTKQNLQRHILKCTGQNLTKKCLYCNTLIPNYKSFCSHSCSARYNNAKRELPEYILKPESIENIRKSNKIRKDIRKEQYLTNPNTCKVCGCILSYEKKNKSNCSKECFKQQMRANALQKKLGGPIKQRRNVILINGQHIVVDSSWEEELANNLVRREIKFLRCDKFILSTGETYTPDFFLPEFNCYVDPKALARFFQKQSSQLEKIKLFEKEYNSKVVLIHKFEHLNFDYIQNSLQL